MRVTALAFLFAPLSMALVIGAPTSIGPETVVVPSGSSVLKLTFGSQTGWVLFQPFYLITAQAVPTRITLPVW